MTDRPDYSKPPSEDAATGERLIPDVAPVGGGDAIASEDAAPDDEGAKPKRKRSYPFWVEVPVLMVLALLIAVVIKTFLVQAFFIPSESMLDTLRVDDRILVNKLAFRFGEPNRGDVVVFDSGELRQESILEAVRRNLAEAVGLSAPESDFVKRVIALPGEVLEIRDNQVYVDDVVLAESYLKPGTAMADFGPVTVEPDHYFMMGDNRGRSSDSRFTGTIHVDRFVGRAFVIVWPPGNWSGL